MIGGFHIIWSDHSSCGETNNTKTCIKFKVKYKICVSEILITDTVCLNEWYFLNIFINCMHFTGKISLLTTFNKGTVTL